MSVRTAMIIIMAISAAIIITAYYCREGWAVGAEWALPGILAALVPVQGRRKNDG